MYTIGLDIGSSSVKCSLLKLSTGSVIASDFSPKTEMRIDAPHPDWAEQDTALWWDNLVAAVKSVLQKAQIPLDEIKAIGISYQMHGLVMVDDKKNVLRPSIIWCDSRAVKYGEDAASSIGTEYCLSNLLNSPGNFTASKFKWVRDNENDIYLKTDKIMLPGDFINMKLTGEINTTVSGLSEGIFWNYKTHSIDEKLLEYYKIEKNVIPEIVPTFGIQGKLTADAARELGLKVGTPVSYRAGDQPNNALALNVLNPGEIAATAGTSGVVYAVADSLEYDSLSRINSFAHVNHSKENMRIGHLLCINGTGISYSWLNKVIGSNITYDEMNNLAESVNIGNDGLIFLPFGNGAERMLNNKNIGAHFSNLNYNIHNISHMIRSVHEGIAFSFCYGINIMRNMGLKPEVLRVGNSNLFLSSLFKEIISTTANINIEVYNTDGSVGAARGAAIGVGLYSMENSSKGLKVLEIVVPVSTKQQEYTSAYYNWESNLNNKI